MSELKKINKLELILAAFISVITTVLASYIFYSYTNKEPNVSFELLPISSFVGDKNPLSIVNITVANDGNKEAELINGYFKFDSTTYIDEEKVGPTPPSIKFLFEKKSSNFYEFSCALLNPGEKISFTFLCRKAIIERNIEIQLRGRGIKIYKKDQSKPSEPNITILFLGTLLMMILASAIIAFVIFHQRKIDKYNEQLQKLNNKRFEILANKLQSLGVNVEEELKSKI